MKRNNRQIVPGLDRIKRLINPQRPIRVEGDTQDDQLNMAVTQLCLTGHRWPPVNQLKNFLSIDKPPPPGDLFMGFYFSPKDIIDILCR